MSFHVQLALTTSISTSKQKMIVYHVNQENTVRKAHLASLATVMKVMSARVVRELLHQQVFSILTTMKTISLAPVQLVTTVPTEAATQGNVPLDSTRTRPAKLSAKNAMRVITALKLALMPHLPHALLDSTVSLAPFTTSPMTSLVAVSVPRVTIV